MIVGHVVNGANDQRISGVTVFISGRGRSDEKTVTDSDGQFVFRALPAGSYQLRAKRSGYLDGELGQRRPGGPSQPLRLAEGEQQSEVTIRLFRPATITGNVTDEAGEPVVQAEVRAYARTWASGRPALSPVGIDATDDRGIYRIGRLTPGDYVIAVPMATGRPAGGTGGAGRMVRDGGASATLLPPSDGTLQKFPTTYYAAGLTAAQATVVSVGLGELRRNIDVQVRPQKVVNISGAVTVATGASRGVTVSLTAAGEDEVAGDRTTATTVTSSGGAFAFESIPAGQYFLRAFVRPGGTESNDVPQWAEQLIGVNDRDLTSVALFLRRGFRVSGRFVLDSAADDSGQWANGLSVTLDPASSRYAGAPIPAAAVDVAAKAFSLSDVMPGRYLIRVASGSLSVKSVMYQGRDVAETSFTLDASDAAGVVITLTDRGTALDGTVSGAADAGEASVLVFPQDPQSWVDFGNAPVNLRTVDVNTSGTFGVRGLPAGDYLVIALDADTVVDWQNPAFLQSAARMATHVRLADGDQRSIDLKIVSIK